MGKPKLHEEDISACVALKKRGLSGKDIAAYLGVAPDTFYRWVNDPKTESQRRLSRELKKAETDAKAAMLATIQAAAASKKTWQAAAWWLERKYPREFARPEVQLQIEAQRESTEQILKGFEDVTIKIREAAFRATGTDEQAG